MTGGVFAETWGKVPTNILVVVIAEVLTLVCGAAYAQMTGIPILWYHAAAAVVVGIVSEDIKESCACCAL